MTLDEMIALRVLTQAEVRRLLEEFSDRTGLKVEAIEVRDIAVSAIGDRESKWAYAVSLEVRL